MEDIAAAADLLAAGLHDDVIGLQARPVAGAALGDGVDPGAHGAVRQQGAHLLHGDAQQRLRRDLPVGEQLVHHPADGLGGDGEAQPLDVGELRHHLDGVDAHHLAVLVDEGPAGVAGVQGHVGLDQGHGPAVHVHVPVQGGDETVRKGAPELHAQGVADGVNRLAHRQEGRVPQLRRGQVPGVHDLEDRQVVDLVADHVLGLVLDVIREGHGAVPPPGHHVVVGEDVAVRRDDDAGPHAGAGVGHVADHRHRGGIHPGVDLLRRQGLPVTGTELHPQVLPGPAAGDGDGLVRGRLLIAGIGLPALVRRVAPGEVEDQHGDDRHQQQDPQGDEDGPPSPAPAGALGRGRLRLPLRRLGQLPVDGPGRGGRGGVPLPGEPGLVEVVLHHLPGRVLEVGQHHLPALPDGFRPLHGLPGDHRAALTEVRQDHRHGLRLGGGLRDVLLGDVRVFQGFRTVFGVLHRQFPRFREWFPHSRDREKRKVVTPSSLVTWICSLCCSRMVLTM